MRPPHRTSWLARLVENWRRHPGRGTLVAVVSACVVAGAAFWAVSTHAPGGPSQQATQPHSVPLPTLPQTPQTSPQTEPTQPTTATPKQAPKKAPKPAPKPAKHQSAASYVLPVHGAVLQGYGWAYSPVLKEWDFHPGWDIQAPKGAPVHAFAAGKVVSIVKNPEQGTVMAVDSQGGIVATYQDLGSIDVKKGATVHAGEIIGTVGAPGTLEANEPPHLHLAIVVQGAAANPAQFFKAQAQPASSN